MRKVVFVGSLASDCSFEWGHDVSARISHIKEIYHYSTRLQDCAASSKKTWCKGLLRRQSPGTRMQGRRILGLHEEVT